MSKPKFNRYRAWTAVALVGAVGLGIALDRSGAIGNEPRAKEVNPTALRHAEQLSEAFHTAQDIAMPSVVTIHSKSKAQPVARSGRAMPPGENPFKGTPFEDFFKDRNFNFMPQNPMPGREGTGSGVIIDSAGLVMTNAHVVRGADEVTVQLADGREYEADDIRTDDHSDLAVIRISGAGPLPAAQLGDSASLRIGDWVMAIGSPFDLDQTVSAGIISGRGRELSSIRRAHFLQTDAAINPGNSGGPLVNLKGEVIGINTAIATNSGSFNGVGFAIPINLAKWVTSQLIAKGTVQRAYLGVGISPMTQDLAEKLGAPADGVLVTKVHADTPAAAAGFEAGDVITRFGDQRVTDPRELTTLVERVPLDSKQEVEVTRGGKTMTLSVTPREFPSDMLETFGGRSEPAPKSEPSKHESNDIGVEVTNATAEQAKQLGLENGGVLVSNVDPSKPGYEAGLRNGMVILKVGDTSVNNVDEFEAAMKDQSLDRKILMYVQVRSGQNAFLVVKP